MDNELLLNYLKEIYDICGGEVHNKMTTFMSPSASALGIGKKLGISKEKTKQIYSFLVASDKLIMSGMINDPVLRITVEGVGYLMDYSRL
ncbi:hypothetical protein LCGC14_1029730 [marine sediment metagenome]|uniref:Uncharacterized protein n=1 Tax=marine sediment metagenome TaxID=412755 RepID=A0A0F9QD19_9ZZZZ